MQTLLRVAKQTSWQVVGKVINSLVTVLILGLVTRVYGPTGVGLFTLVLAYLSFFYFATDLGLNAHLLPRLSSQRQLVWPKLLGFRISWSLVLVGIALSLLLFLPFATPEFNLAVLLSVGSIALSAISLSAVALFQEALRFDLATLALSLGAITTLSLTYLLARFPVSFLLIGTLAGWLVNAAASLALARAFISNLRPKLDRSFISQTLKEAWPLSLTLFLSLVYFRVDTFILSSTRSLSEVGIYNVAYSLFQSALLLSTFIINSYYPLMLTALKAGPAQFKRSVLWTELVMLGLAVVGIIATQLLAPFFIGLITGSANFSGSVTALKILSLSFPAFFLSAILMWTLITLKKYQSLVSIYVAGLIFNLLANLFIIPHYSYIGASLVTVISEYLILTLQIAILGSTL